jgi:type II secretion system protein G
MSTSRRTKKVSSGFTLIELLVVVAIIAILAAIAIPNFLEAQIRAKVSRVKSDMRTVATAMEAYVTDHNRYPPNFNTGLYPPISIVSEALSYAQLTTPLAYITKTPMDTFGPDAQNSAREQYFDYIGIDTVAAQSALYPPGATAFWQATGTRWYCGSRGPDRMFGSTGIPANAFGSLGHYLQTAPDRVYDPTNGTVSAGDLGRTNRGIVQLGG